MQKKMYTLFVLLSVVLDLIAATPTTPATNISFSAIDGGSFQVNWTNGNGQRRIVIARQFNPVTAIPVNGVDYLHDDDFGLGQEIAPGEFVVYDGTGNNFDIRSLQPATVYHFAIYEYNGSGASTEYISAALTGNRSTLSAPTLQPSTVAISNVSGNSMKISWTAGNGTKRLVIARAGAAVNANPSDLVNYNASSSFGSGAQIGSGNYVVHFSSTNTVTITDLQPNTTYHFSIFESNGNSNPVFHTVNPAIASQSTLTGPSIAASNINFSLIEGNRMRVEWTKGNGARRIVVAREGAPVDAIPVDGVDYIPGTSTTMPFNTAPEIAPGQKVVYDNISSTLDITGLLPNTVYHYKVFEYDGTGTTIAYLTSQAASGNQSTAIPPAVIPSGLTFSDITGNSMKLSWTNGNGTKRIVVAKAGVPVDGLPVDLINYSGQSTFGNGTQIGSGNYVVYSGNGNTFTVSGLSLNQQYHFAVFEANGTNYPVYNTSPATGSETTTDRPTQSSANISFSEVEGNEMKLQWATGNGQKRIVVVSENSPVTAIPADGVDYLSSASSSFTTAPEIAPGQKVVYDNTGSQFTLTGLSTGNTYYYRIYEYSGSGSSIAYLTGSFAQASRATIVAPATASGNIHFTAVTGNSMTINWTNGNGSRRLVIAKAGAPVDVVPVNYTSYNYSAVFGNGTQLGAGNFVIANTTTSSITLTNLNLNTTYHFAVFEFNGLNGPVYLTNAFAFASHTTADRPTQAASNMNFGSIDGNEMRVSWTSGNGQRRIVIARANSPVDAVPVDGMDYLAGNSASFTAAPEIAPGQKVIYDNTGNLTDLAGLQPNTTYYFRVYEYSGSGTGIAYLTSSFATGSRSTLTHPTQQASSVAFTSVTSTSMIVSWTAGNGSNKLVIAKKGSPVDANPVDLSVYNSSSTFGNGAQIGNGNYVVAKSNSTNFTLTNLTPGTTYHIAVVEFNGVDGPLYLLPAATGHATTIGPPAIQASAPFVSNIGINSLQLNWTNGSGNKRLVLMKQGAPVDAVPTNNAAYFANSFFGSGTEIGNGNYVVFNGIQDFVTVTNLTSGSVYYFTVFEYNDFGSTSQYLFSAPATSSSATGVLPVSLIEFKASLKDQSAKLYWATAWEENSSHFEIEASINGSSFSKIGQVAAAGNSQVKKEYSFVYKQAALTYYRLKQVDKDGKFAYSSIIRVDQQSKEFISSIVNPVTSQLVIRLHDTPASTLTLSIYDASGKLMKKMRFREKQVSADLSGFANGIYFIELNNQNTSQKLRIVKQ